jgi:hypothetical protein
MTIRVHSANRYWFALLLPLITLFAGCGSGRYPVTGRITYEDGSPVPAGTVIAEATIEGKLVGVQANIEKDGSFRWGGANPGDGALPGQYRVLITSPTLSDAEKALGNQPLLDGKYGRYESSEITFEVKAGKNELPITVSRPKRGSDSN